MHKYLDSVESSFQNYSMNISTLYVNLHLIFKKIHIVKFLIR